MVFSYYNRLSFEQKKVYRRSDEISSVIIPGAEEARPVVAALAEALASEDRPAMEKLFQRLAVAVVKALRVPPIRVRVLAVRPSNSLGELHGLYEPSQGRASAVISLWMRTARQKRVVAFKTFFRTFLHEFCHHLDYELFGLDESFHTEGFYQRESSMFHQLVSGDAK
jgi:hypothetical protein